MSTLNDHFDDAADDYINVPIEADETGQPRYPFVFLIDVSQSTTLLPPGADKTDIESLNEMLLHLFSRLHSGPPDDELEKHRPYIDVSVITYADRPHEHLPWTRADAIQASPPPLNALPASTAMGKALSFAINHVRKMQQHYRTQKLAKSGVPIIFHITDGGAKDIGPEEQKLLALKQSIDSLNPGGEAPTKTIVYHFVTPNGYRIAEEHNLLDANGKHITGEELLVRMFGRHHVMALQHGVDSFSTLVRFITQTISSVSQGKTPTAEMLENLMKMFNVDTTTRN